VQIALILAPPALGPSGVVLTALALFAAVAWGAWRAERG
jgi:hypothetical protein